MVGPRSIMSRSRIRSRGKHYILAESRACELISKNPEDYLVKDRYKGKELAGTALQASLSLFCRSTASGRFPGHCWKRVSLWKREQASSTRRPLLARSTFMPASEAGIELVCPVDNNGSFTDEIPEYAGQFVKDADKEIIRTLEERGALSFITRRCTTAIPSAGAPIRR